MEIAIIELDGRRWTGETERGIPCGRGTMTAADGTEYTGSLDGRERGRGVWKYPDGSRMVGGFTLCREAPLFLFTSPDGRETARLLRYFVSEPGAEPGPADGVCRLLRDAAAEAGAELEFNARALLADEILTRGLGTAEGLALLRGALAAADGPLIRLSAAAEVIFAARME